MSTMLLVMELWFRGSFPRAWSALIRQIKNVGASVIVRKDEWSRTDGSQDQ